MKIDDIAKVAHQVNKAYCESLNDMSQKDWSSCDQWQRDSAIKGVEYFLKFGLETTQEAMHDSWMQEKIEHGWVYGPVKNTLAKTHPCLVPYSDLPNFQQTKDHIFLAVVKTLAGYLT